MPTLVVITGIDGAGKSTLARRLLVHLTARNLVALQFL